MVVLKEQKYHLYLSDDEYSRVLQSLIRLKNSLTAQDRYTDGVDDILCKMISAKKRKFKIKYIWTYVCIDTCSTLGICAERNAIFNMITNGEQEIDKVLCILPDGSNGAPCGACRELMVQLMAGKYHDIEIMLDYTTGRTVKLGEITPEWWIQ